MYCARTFIARHERQFYHRVIMILKYLALASLVVLYSLMFIGGYVSASGLGLSCPDWPLCPSGVLPTEEYLIEWTHRFVAATTGVLIVATAVASWLSNGSHKKIRITGTLAGIFVVTQITLGAIVIDLKLHALLVAIHLGIGILLFAMTLLTTLFAFRLGKVSVQAKV
jgi:cytochrome c oxidase assembly protein subunit 15